MYGKHGHIERVNLTLDDYRYKKLRARRVLFLDSSIGDGSDNEYCRLGTAIPDFYRDLILLTTGDHVRKEPIWILLNSSGGDVHQGFAAYDMIRAVAEKGISINILCVGAVASAAVMVLQAGTKRYAFPNTQFLLHQVALPSEGDTEKASNVVMAKEIRRINNDFMRIIAKRSGENLKWLLALTERGARCYTAAEARKFGRHGLIDKVVTELPFRIEDRAST